MKEFLRILAGTLTVTLCALSGLLAWVSALLVMSEEYDPTTTAVALVISMICALTCVMAGFTTYVIIKSGANQ